MNKMGRIDPVTGKIDEFDIPVEDSSRGRWGPMPKGTSGSAFRAPGSS
jgi:hypothetical protein